MLKKLFGRPFDVANSGLYMGFAASIVAFIDKCKSTQHYGDDQRAFNLALESTPGAKIDDKSRIFYNVPLAERYGGQIEKDTVFIQFNGALTIPRCKRMLVEYSPHFTSEFMAILVGAGIGIVAARRDSFYRCGRSTHTFGIMFPLFVIYVSSFAGHESAKCIFAYFLASTMCFFHIDQLRRECVHRG